MPTTKPTQAIFERFLRYELSQDEAVEAFLELIRARKQPGGEPIDLTLDKPRDWPLATEDELRAEALLEAVDRRLSWTSS